MIDVILTGITILLLVAIIFIQRLWIVHLKRQVLGLQGYVDYARWSDEMRRTKEEMKRQMMKGTK